MFRTRMNAFVHCQYSMEHDTTQAIGGHRNSYKTHHLPPSAWRVVVKDITARGAHHGPLEGLRRDDDIF